MGRKFRLFSESPFIKKITKSVRSAAAKRKPDPVFRVKDLLIFIAALFWGAIFVTFSVLFLVFPSYPSSQIPEALLEESCTGPSLFLNNPTYEEVEEFIKSDETDKNEYVPNKYVCGNFAEDVVANATEQGIRAGYVAMDFREPEQGEAIRHAIICFDTRDKGLIFIEPQEDLEVKVVIGKSYWQGVEGRNLFKKMEIVVSCAHSATFRRETSSDIVEKVIIEWNGRTANAK